MKKLMNDPYDVCKESLEGMCFAYKNLIEKLPDCNVVVRKNLPDDNRVRIVIGGGSGHEPVFAGFVGEGMADAAASGDVFTSPSADLVQRAIEAAGGENGTILIYGNYQGDILNFDMAQELCRMDGKRVETILVWDDIASSSPDNKEVRRGTAADLLVIKIAGAAAGQYEDFDEVLRVVRKARDNCRSIGVALSSCTLPAVGKPIFTLAEDRMMLGMGLHGEAGVKEIPLLTADAAADIMLESIFKDDLGLEKGDEAILLVNGYGSTTLLELFIVSRRATQILEEKGVSVYANPVGNYCTSLEMAGCSITLMKLDDELKSLFDAKADSPGFVKMK